MLTAAPEATLRAVVHARLPLLGSSDQLEGLAWPLTDARRAVVTAVLPLIDPDQRAQVKSQGSRIP
jgi:hypothetical protein